MMADLLVFSINKLSILKIQLQIYYIPINFIEGILKHEYKTGVWGDISKNLLSLADESRENIK